MMNSRGLEGVVANTTRLSAVIGDKGQLVYCRLRHQRAGGQSRAYEEVVYLLWNNRLPNREELERCVQSTAQSSESCPTALSISSKPRPEDAAPMDVIRTAVSMLGLYDPNVRRKRQSRKARNARAASRRRSVSSPRIFIVRGMASRCHRSARISAKRRTFFI